MQDIKNWREEETLNLTSDISSDESHRSDENVDTSTNTLLPQNSTADNSAILIPQTPVAVHNLSSSSAQHGRLSLSQPVLSKATPSPSSRLNMSAGNIARPPRPQRVPLIKTQEENEHLRHQLAEFNAKLSVAEYKVMELERMLPRQVQDILEEYYSLQNSRLDLITEREELAAARRQLEAEMNQADTTAQKKIDKINLKLSDSERERKVLKKENEELRKRIEELEARLAAAEEIPTSLDALKGDDSDWTIRSEHDVVIGDLQERLYTIQRENEGLNKKIEELKKVIEEKDAIINQTTQGKDGHTFVIGDGHDAETLLQRIDDLEARLREEQDERAKANTALAAYMSRYHKLEKKLHEANVSIDKSLKASNKEEVKATVEQLRDLLRHLATDNKKLREECARLLKEQCNISSDSTDRSVENESGVKNALAQVCGAEGDYEEKQRQLLRDLQSFAAMKNGNASLLNMLEDACREGEIHITDADFGSSTTDSPSQLQAPQGDSAAVDNLPLLNASINELMNLSLNTSKDIANFKERLSLFRGVMERIFETLRNSGVLLEEVLEKFGSESDEHRALAEKIREMKFVWNTYLNETNEIMEAIDDTQFNLNEVETKMIAFEKSIHEASFRMDMSVVHTTSHYLTQSDVYNRSHRGRISDEDANVAQVASQKEEIANLQSLLKEVEAARDSAMCTLEDVRFKLKKLESEVAQISEERENLKVAEKAVSTERDQLQVKLQEQLNAFQQLEDNHSELQSSAEELLREVADKDANMIEMEARMSNLKQENERLKQLAVKYEENVNSLHEALEEEHERKSEENNALRAELATAQETSQSLRRDIDKFRQEYNSKEATIRQLREQYETALENNAHMAQIVAELEQAAREKQRPTRKTSENSVTTVAVQPEAPTAELRTQDSQTDMTRTALAQIEFDSVSYASEVKAFRSAYVELATAIGELVVKDINNLPSPGDLNSIEKSCKELSRFIRHEKRRRDQQAVEIAEVTEKVKDFQRREASGDTALRDVSQVMPAEQAKYASGGTQKKYEDPMRQTLYVLTRMAMELVTELRQLAQRSACGEKVDFTSIINQARELRNELNDRFMIVRADKENINSYHVPDLINTVELLSKDNRTLYESLKRCKAEYEALEKQSANNPELVEKIAAQLQNIHTAMVESKRACELLQTAKTSSRPKQSVDESDLQYAAVMHGTVARTTVSGLELLMLYLEAEIHRARARIREYGIRIRRFFREGIHIDYRRIARRFIDLSDVRVPADQLSDLDEDEAMIFNAVPLRSRWKPPKYTFNDIAIVLTTDEEVEEGVVHAYTIRSPAWSCLPPPIAPCKRDSEVGDFQFLNRPLKMSIADDDDERLSLPSTMVTDQDLKIQSLEAQLAMLSRQMQSLLSGKLPAARPQDITPALSDDEGKGTSLCSPDDTVKVLVPPEHQQMPALPKVCPPSGPPPPPPPPPSLLSIRSVSAPAIPSPAKRTVLQMLNKSAQGDNEALPVRPSVFDLSNVQLKKTNTARSPGGTPVVRKVRAQAGADEGNYLANALREKFRSVQETLSEHEDDVNNSSWLDDEADF